MERPPALDPELVNDFVRVAHSDLDQVKKLLAQEQRLVNASWDWGGGDWETGLGAAAHMGRRDIALFLLENGAHIDIYAAAMLGKLEIVKAILDDNPAAVHYPGPHTIPLIAHAKQGGEEAAAVLAYLECFEERGREE